MRSARGRGARPRGRDPLARTRKSRTLRTGREEKAGPWVVALLQVVVREVVTGGLRQTLLPAGGEAGQPGEVGQQAVLRGGSVVVAGAGHLWRKQYWGGEAGGK